MTWDPDTADAPQPPHSFGTWLRFVLRAIPFAALCFGGLAVVLILRQPERWRYGLHRPYTPYITQFVCKGFFVITGITLNVRGTPMKEHGAIIANHASWTDIFTLHAAKRVYYVSKVEVRGWFGIGWLARATGTIFINRVRGEAKQQQKTLSDRLSIGHKLLFFPEGTSTDSIRVLPFKTTLFSAFFDPDLHSKLFVQPVTVIYKAPKGQPETFYGWWGDMSFGWHLVLVLGARKQGQVDLIYHPPIKVSDYPDRKALARACEEIVRSGMPPERQLT